MNGIETIQHLNECAERYHTSQLEVPAVQHGKHWVAVSGDHIFIDTQEKRRDHPLLTIHYKGLHYPQVPDNNTGRNLFDVVQNVNGVPSIRENVTLDDVHAISQRLDIEDCVDDAVEDLLDSKS